MKGRAARVTLCTSCLAAALFVSSCAPSERYLLRQREEVFSGNRYVRVLVKKARDEVVVSSGDKIKLTDMNDRSFKYFEGGRRISFRAGAVRSPLELESWNSPLSVDGVPYRGTIELHNVTGTLFVINSVKLEEYLFGVVPSEMPSLWPLEAIKSQAVAARTYAYYHITKHKNLLYDLDATTKSQVYGGMAAEVESTNRAVTETSGEIIAHRQGPILSYFHSTCGGRTIDDRYVWTQNDLPYLGAVTCPYCADSPKLNWEYRLRTAELRGALRKEHPGIRSIKQISFKRLQGRVASVVVRHNEGLARLTGNQFRMMISPMKIKSLAFEVKKEKGALLLKGKGWGHGVGLCQYGARGMAERGMSHRDILKHYYRDVDIIKIDGSRDREPSGDRQVARRTTKRGHPGHDE